MQELYKMKTNIDRLEDNVKKLQNKLKKRERQRLN